MGRGLVGDTSFETRPEEEMVTVGIQAVCVGTVQEEEKRETEG